MSRILLVSLNHAPEATGIGRFNGEMVAWLVDRGHEVRVVTAPPYYPAWRIAPEHRTFLPRREERDGARVYRVPIYVPRVPGGTRRLLHLASFALASAPVIFAQALSWRPDLVMMTEPTLAAAPAVLFATRLCGARSLLHVQDFEIDAGFDLGIVGNPRIRRAAAWIERRLMTGFTHVSTISQRMLERLTAKGIDPACSLLLPNWADLERIRPDVDGASVRHRLGLDDDVVLALYSGNIGHKQGIGTVIDAARLLAGDHKICFVICGDGAGRPGIEKNAAGLQNIKFLTLQPEAELPALLAAADIHLLPQRAGAADLVMPSKLGNMLASSRPVIVGADVGTQLFEAIQGCGLAVPPEDSETLAAALRALAGDPARRAMLGCAARKKAEEELGQEAALSGLARLLGEPVDGPDRASGEAKTEREHEVTML